MWKNNTLLNCTYSFAFLKQFFVSYFCSCLPFLVCFNYYKILFAKYLFSTSTRFQIKNCTLEFVFLTLYEINALLLFKLSLTVIFFLSLYANKWNLIANIYFFFFLNISCFFSKLMTRNVRYITTNSSNFDQQ